MKKLFTFLLLMAASLQSFSQVTWGTPVTVTTAMGSNLHPRIKLNRSGAPYILWGQTDTRAYLSKWNGTGFTTPVVPSGSLTIFAQTWAGPDLAAFGDTVYVSMKVTPEMTTTNYTYLAHSYNGGTSFSAPVRIDNIGYNVSRFPIVTTTASGNPLVSFMKFDSGTMMNARYVVSRSSDYGMTFSIDTLASKSANPVCDCCPGTIISSGSNAIMLYRDNASNIRDMWASISNNGGLTFNTANKIAVDNNNWMISSCPSSGPGGIAIGDSIYTVFMSKGTGTSLVYLSRSSISGLSSSTAAITGMFTGLNSQNYPRIANAGNAATAVWVQNTSSGISVVSSFANNISSGFAGYTAVTGATGSGIMNADVAMTPGAIHIVWEDDNTGKIMYIKGTYTVPSSVPQLASKQMIEVYPNPADDNFTITLNNISTISNCYLTDNAGRNIGLTPVIKNGKAIFSLTGIAKGGYYFVMNDDAGKIYYSKLIVQ